MTTLFFSIIILGTVLKEYLIETKAKKAKAKKAKTKKLKQN